MEETIRRGRLELAVYGKGGIGKSTISANLSAAFARKGRKVLHIGCDPKHDSTKLLLHGKRIPTVLDCLKEAAPEEEVLRTVLNPGIYGIGCIEAGGPKPGVGCAGRGIISSFEFLAKQKVKENYDTVVYDVLGDVVCGGFAVPIRREYADVVLIVTSGEYMALYAANNILRGVRNFDGDKYRRVAGIIYNERKLPDEDGRVARFARAVGLPICARIPRSEAFARAEEAMRTAMELDGYEEIHQKFLTLSDRIHAGMELYEAKPLSDEELERVVLGVPDGRENAPAQAADLSGKPGAAAGNAGSREALRKERRRPEPSGDGGSSYQKRPPLYGCAFNGAITTAVHITDALVIAHSPKACAFYAMQNLSSPGRRNLFNRGVLMPSAISPNFACTQMAHKEAVFGGMDALREAVRGALAEKPGAVIVVSSCVSGIIGDDIREIEELSTPETPVIAVKADGDIAGDYMEGVRMAMYEGAGRLIDPEVRPEGRLVNILNETGLATTSELNFRIIRTFLERMDVGVNCRFLGEATCGEVKNFLRAPLNILAVDNEEGRKLKRFMETRYGAAFLDDPFPVGFHQTERWLRSVGRVFSREAEAEALIEEKREEYWREIRALRPLFEGKRVVMTTINANMDWLLDTAADLGMEFPWIGVINYLHMEVHITDHPERYPAVEETMDNGLVMRKARELRPDIVLSNYTPEADGGDYVVDSIPMAPVAGFLSGIEAVRRWGELMQKKEKGEWMHDREMFEKYYAG